MEANPQIPDAYRQECFAGEAEDTAWVVATEGSSRVPYGNVRNVLTTLEATRVEAGAYDEKVYGPGSASSASGLSRVRPRSRSSSV
jgi:hypothetical protein